MVRRMAKQSHLKHSVGIPVHWSKAAVASTALGIVGFGTLWLIGGLFVAGIAAVLGHVGRHETAEGELRGRGLATFGLIAGYGSMFLFPILALITAISFPAFYKYQSDQTESQMATSQENTAALFAACEAYARANYNRYPTDWQLLAGSYMSAREVSKTLKSPYPGGDSVAFELVPHDRPVLPAISDSVIVIQEIAPRSVYKIAVVDANGTVKMLINPDYETP